MEQKVEFSVEEINQILAALGKIPAEFSMNLIMFIKKTAEDQLGTSPAETPAEELIPEE